MARAPRDPQQAPDPAGQITLTRTQVQLQAGPLPAPEVIAQYEAVLPGAAERIIAMAEAQAEHRMRLERSVIDTGNRRSILGLCAALVVTLACVLGGTYAIVHGHDWAGGIVCGGSLAGLAGTFVYGSQSLRAERENRLKALTRK